MLILYGELVSRASAIPLTSIPAQNEDLIRISSSRSSINTDDEMHAQPDTSASPANENALAWNFLPRLPSAPTAASGITDPLNTLETSQPETGEMPPAIPASELVPGTIDPSAQRWPVPEPRPNWDGEREEDSQDDESTDEEDFPFWANLKEDISSPDEEELKVIEGNKNEISALDRK